MAARVPPGKALPGYEVLHRAVLKSRWLDENGEVTAEAFMLRESDQGRFSVCRGALKPWAECQRHFKKVYGGAALRVSRIRSLRQGFLPIADPSADRPEHATILNLPDPRTEPFRAEQAASMLRALARRV